MSNEKKSIGSDISKGRDEDSLTINTGIPPAYKPMNMQPEKKELSKGFILMCLVANIFLSISIVLVNKSVYEFYKFPNMTLTCLHFICTSVGMFVCQLCGMFTVKKVPLPQMIPIALTFCGFVVFTNKSLQYNTVGTYQIIKSLTTPCIILIQSYFYARHFSKRVMLTLVPIICGVWLNSYYDLKFNMTGIILASVGVLVTSLYQVFVGEKQKELNINAMQMLYYQAPLSALFLGLVVPFFEPIFTEGGLFGGWSLEAMGMVALSGTFAFAINVSIFWIIGNTSPLTYNMVGQFKFSMVILGGFVLFRDPLQALQLVGIGLTFSGVFAYTWFKLKEQAAEKLQNQQAEANKPLIRETKISIADNSNVTSKT